MLEGKLSDKRGERVTTMFFLWLETDVITEKSRGNVRSRIKKVVVANDKME